MSIKSWFSTFIYFDRLQKAGGKKFNDELLKECFQIRDYDKEGKKWCAKHYPGGYTSYSSIPHVHKMSSTFISLEEKIKRHVLQYAKHLDFDLRGRILSMTDCWINIMPKQVMHSGHIHPLATISGTYYVKTPKNCSLIKFEDPRLSRFMAAPPRREGCKPANKSFVSYKPEAGSLVLFESWLRHEVEANQADEERVSISFNYHW